MRRLGFVLALLLLDVAAVARPRVVDLKDPFNPRRPVGDLKNPFLTASAAPTPPPGEVGIELAPMSRNLRRYFGAPPSTGVLVTKVEQSSPAGNAGVHVGDVIVEVGASRVVDSQHVLDAVADAWVGSTQLALTVIRNKTRLRLHSSGAVKQPPAREIDPDGVIAPDERDFAGGHPSLDYYENDPDGIMPPDIAENPRGGRSAAALRTRPSVAPAPPADEMERLRVRVRNLERRLGAVEARRPSAPPQAPAPRR